jgi:hypothetical protein
MIRRAFEGFTAVVPEGWSFAPDEGTYSEPGAASATRFRPAGGGGAVVVSVPALHPDEQPGADAAELESLAREWGMRRGIDEPLSIVTEKRQGHARASASYRIADDLVEVWFVSDGTALLTATHVCPFRDRDRHRAPREALIGSLRLGSSRAEP